MLSAGFQSPARSESRFCQSHWHWTSYSTSLMHGFLICRLEKFKHLPRRLQ